MGLFGNRETKEEKAERKRQEKLDREIQNEENIKNSKKSLANMDAAVEHLEEDEEVIDFLFGMYDSKMLGEKTVRNGVLIATNKRIVFFGKKMIGYDMETVDYDKISSLDYGKGMAFGKLKIYTSGNKIEFQTSMEHHARNFMKIIKEKTTGPISSSVSEEVKSEKSPVEQLKEYKELLDMDIITQDELEAKKKELLSL